MFLNTDLIFGYKLHSLQTYSITGCTSVCLSVRILTTVSNASRQTGRNENAHRFLYIVSGIQPASYSMGTWPLSPRVKWPGPEADNSPPSSAEVKNAWRYTSSPIRFHDVALI